jgi:hypothetical protein
MLFRRYWCPRNRRFITTTFIVTIGVYVILISLVSYDIIDRKGREWAQALVSRFDLMF